MNKNKTFFSFYEKNTLKKSDKIKNIEEIAEIIKHEEKIKEITLKIKNAKGSEKEKRSLKSLLPCFVMSGIKKTRKENSGDEKYQSVIGVDFDDVKDKEFFYDRVKNDPHVLLAFKTGGGIRCLVKHNAKKEEHLAAFVQIKTYFEKEYGLVADEACKDVWRLSYIWHDPDCVYNPNAQIFIVKKEVEQNSANKNTKNKTQKNVAKNNNPLKRENINKKRSKYYNLPKEETEKILEYALRECVAQKKDLTQTYNDWLYLGFALAEELDADGEKWFLEFSSLYPDFDVFQCMKQWDECLKSETNKKENENKIFFDFFFILLEKYNVDLFKEKVAIRKLKNTGEDIEYVLSYIQQNPEEKVIVVCQRYDCLAKIKAGLELTNIPHTTVFHPEEKQTERVLLTTHEFQDKAEKHEGTVFFLGNPKDIKYKHMPWENKKTIVVQQVKKQTENIHQKIYKISSYGKKDPMWEYAIKTAQKNADKTHEKPPKTVTWKKICQYQNEKIKNFRKLCEENFYVFAANAAAYIKTSKEYFTGKIKEFYDKEYKKEYEAETAHYDDFLMVNPKKTVKYVAVSALSGWGPEEGLKTFFTIQGGNDAVKCSIEDYAVNHLSKETTNVKKTIHFAYATMAVALAEFVQNYGEIKSLRKLAQDFAVKTGHDKKDAAKCLRGFFKISVKKSDRTRIYTVELKTKEYESTFKTVRTAQKNAAGKIKAGQKIYLLSKKNIEDGGKEVNKMSDEAPTPTPPPLLAAFIVCCASKVLYDHIGPYILPPLPAAS